jgi:regulatory protein
MGKSRIRMELVRKGLPREMIDRTMEQLPKEEADDAAIRLAQKLLRRHNGEDTRKEMQKVLAAMARRGYSYEDSKEAIEAALQAEDDDV